MPVCYLTLLKNRCCIEKKVVVCVNDELLFCCVSRGVRRH